MAKKRVHEIAKANGLTSKELLEKLQAAGVEAKAAQSNVEESDALAALKSSGNGARSLAGARQEARRQEAAAKKAVAKSARRPCGGQGTGRGEAEGRPPSPPLPRPPRPRRPSPPPPATPPRRQAGSAVQSKADGAGAGAGSKKRRRVVIDSQAARRDHIAKNQPPPRPPRRRGGRRRRPLLEEPVDKTQEAPEEAPTNRVAAGATVREVAESLGLGSAEVIKALMESGEMATLTQTLTDD